MNLSIDTHPQSQISLLEVIDFFKLLSSLINNRGLLSKLFDFSVMLESKAITYGKMTFDR